MQDEREDAQEPEAPEGAANETPAEGEQTPPETPQAAADEGPAEETPAEEPVAEEAPAEETPAEEVPAEEPVSEETPAEEPTAEEAPAEEPAAEEAPAEDVSTEDAPAEDAAAEEPPAEEALAEDAAAGPPAEAAAEGAPAEEGERPRERRKERKQDDKPKEDVIPGAHLEPDIVFEEPKPSKDDEYAQYAQYVEPDAEGEEPVAAEGEEPAAEDAEAQPVALTPRELAADARYLATGKRKSAIARVILKPGEGTYSVNGRHLDEYFPRVRLQRMARQPLEAAGYQSRMDVVARIHGGGVAAQATALRHGIARALVEADPNLRGELKRRGYLTRDPRVKERKKAGLKKARKRPQFSKR